MHLFAHFFPSYNQTFDSEQISNYTTTTVARCNIFLNNNVNAYNNIKKYTQVLLGSPIGYITVLPYRMILQHQSASCSLFVVYLMVNWWCRGGRRDIGTMGRFIPLKSLDQLQQSSRLLQPYRQYRYVTRKFNGSFLIFV